MELEIRPFDPKDATQVEALFTKINRELAPPEMKERFETYISTSITEEIGRVISYYSARNGHFWVAYEGNTLVGMVGVEQHRDGAMELRRMYVSPAHRRKGIAHKMLGYVEDRCRNMGVTTMVLSTSELQPAAINFYEVSGYRLTGESKADTASNKTIGGGIKRRYYSKNL